MPKTPVPGGTNLQHVSEIMARNDMILSLKKVFFFQSVKGELGHYIIH